MFVSIRTKVYTDTTGAYTELPALLTPAGVLEPLLDYCMYRSHDRSLTWMSKVTRSVRMFLEYLQTNPAEYDTSRLFQSFAQRLYTGTFDRETGLDPSGLCWAPRSPQDAGHIITHLTDFFDWLSEMRPEAAKVNPRYAGGAFDRQADEAGVGHKQTHHSKDCFGQKAVKHPIQTNRRKLPSARCQGSVGILTIFFTQIACFY